MTKSSGKVVPVDVDNDNDSDLRDYDTVLSGVIDLLESARRASARSVNAVITTTYWKIGRRIVESEQGGRNKADYGKHLIERLSKDLTVKFGRGFGRRNIYQMRAFYLAYPGIVQTPSAQLDTMTGDGFVQTASAELSQSSAYNLFPLPWSHYVKLLGVKNPDARAFYENEALRGGWSVRQMERQITTMFYERALLSKNKAAMLKKGAEPLSKDSITPEEEIKNPFVLEFLGLKDEYSENNLEEALILQLENFLMELGSDFAFVGRQRRLRIGDEWYRVDLLFFHRRLRCLVVIDLKLGKFTHADAGQMHLYLNYAKEHWTHAGENPPVGLILCAQRDAAEYRMTLPDEKILAAELERTQRLLEERAGYGEGKGVGR